MARLDKRGRQQRRATIRRLLGLTLVSNNLSLPKPEVSNIKAYDLKRPDSLGVVPDRFRAPYTAISIQRGTTVQVKGKVKLARPVKADEKRFHDTSIPRLTASAVVGHRLTKRKHRKVLSKTNWKGVYAR